VCCRSCCHIALPAAGSQPSAVSRCSFGSKAGAAESLDRLHGCSRNCRRCYPGSVLMSSNCASNQQAGTRTGLTTDKHGYHESNLDLNLGLNLTPAPTLDSTLASTSNPVGQSTPQSTSESSRRRILDGIAQGAGQRVFDSILNSISTLTLTCIDHCSTNSSLDSLRNCTGNRSRHSSVQCSRQSSGHHSLKRTLDCPQASYGGGIGGVRTESVNSELIIRKLGLIRASGGMYTTVYIQETEYSRPRQLPLQRPARCDGTTFTSAWPYLSPPLEGYGAGFRPPRSACVPAPVSTSTLTLALASPRYLVTTIWRTAWRL
jgi:hypothetical protein